MLFPEGKAGPAGEAEGESAFQRHCKAFIALALRRRWIALGASAGLFAAAVAGFPYVKDGFFPTSTTPQIVIDYWLREGTDIAHTREDLLDLELRVAALDGVDAVQTLIGGGLRYMLVYGPVAANSACGQLLVRATNYEGVATLPQLQAMIDNDYPDRPRQGVKSTQPNSHQSSNKAAADQTSAAKQPDTSVVAARGRRAGYANGCGTSPVISRNRSACWSRNAFMAASKRAASARVFSGPETHTSSGFAPAVDGLCPSVCSWARADTRAECPT